MNPGTKVYGWEAWYTNNPEAAGWRTYRSDDLGDEKTSWEALPDDGFEGVMLFLTNDQGHKTRQAMSGFNYVYRWEGPDGVVYDGGNDSLESLQTRYPNAIFKKGRSVTLEVMHDIDTEMMLAKFER